MKATFARFTKIQRIITVLTKKIENYGLPIFDGTIKVSQELWNWLSSSKAVVIN